MKNSRKSITYAAASAAALLAGLAAPAFAQNAASPAPADAPAQTDDGTLLSDIVVTGTKQSRAQAIQSVPVTISAFSAAQIENMKLTSISRMAYSMPNVSFETVGNTRGTANFAIRGLGLNSSVASTAPTVGVFTNGMYLGLNTGLLVDTFDMDGIEVLRGPQGTLFGRNVTGGAVLLNNRKPQQKFDLNLRGRISTGPEYSLSGATGGGLTDTVSVRVAAIYRKDEGYFHNPTLGRNHFGAEEIYTIRPSIRYKNAGTDVTVFGEYGKDKGDGPVIIAPDYSGGTPAAAGVLPPRGYSNHTVYENFAGLTDTRWYSVVLNGTQDVGFGENGQIALISGYRNFLGHSLYAADGTELTVSHNGSFTKQHQISNELRYNGKFFNLMTATIGLYQFSQDMTQLNKQIPINSTQGGRLRESALGVFGQLDFNITNELTLQLGGRYTHESKTADIAALASETLVPRAGTFGVAGACNFDAGTCTYQYTNLKQKFNNFSPKIGLQYKLQNVQFYATAQKAYRSGGFNIRYNAVGSPAPFDAEKQTAYEIGFKSDLFDRKTRFNGAVFLTKVKNLQRDITIFNPDLTNKSYTANTADATVKGFELEFVQQIVPDLVFNANVGYVHAKYDKILQDITQDPAALGGAAVTAFDYQQKLPRVSPWTYSAGITASHSFSFGKVTFVGNYNHRDASYFPDYNIGRRDGADPKLPAVDLFDAQISLDVANTGLSLSLFGQNLTDAYSLGAFTPIVYPTLKGCACVINKGRVLGAEVTFKY